MSAGTWREDLYAEKEEVGNFFRLKGVWGEAEIRNYQKVNFLQPCSYVGTHTRTRTICVFVPGAVVRG